VHALNRWFLSSLVLLGLVSIELQAQIRGSIVEDRVARKLLEAGDTRLDSSESDKAIEIWQSVIERYPRSKIRFDAHLRLGNYFLEKENAYDKARGHFETSASEDNTDVEKRAHATLKMGVCFYEARIYGKCFKVMRDVIENYPVSAEVNNAYYYIGMGHFKQGHYSRAIEALEKVGTAVSDDDTQIEKVEAGKRLYVKVEDADLAILSLDDRVDIQCSVPGGDTEILQTMPVGRNVRVVLGSIPTALGKPIPNNGTLDLKGGDTVEVTYVDQHTAEREFDRKILKKIAVVGNATVQIMDGAFQDDLQGVVLGKEANLQITDADFDISDAADSLTAKVSVYRPKTEEELGDELAEKIAKGEIQIDESDETGEQPMIDRWKKIDAMTVTLKEISDVKADVPNQTEAERLDEDPMPELPDEGNGSVDDFLAEVEQDAIDDSIHTGIFRGTIPVVLSSEVTEGDDKLQAQPSDQIRVEFVDERHRGTEAKTLVAKATCIEGNLGGVRVTRTEIQDEELRLKTKLRTASALCNIGNHYKEFGLEGKAKAKYGESLEICEEITGSARKIGGSFLEETYVQLWRIYFAMDELKLAGAVSRRLQNEFPNSSFVDEAVLQQAQVARQEGNLGTAVTLFKDLLNLKNSSLRGEGQYGIAECYELMAEEAAEGKKDGLYEKAFEEYRKVYTEFPESGRVGEAVAKMANFYYQKKDYARAVDVFESVLTEHPDANFLDVILFNYGRCLYRLENKKQARKQFDQLINDFPDSELAAEAKRISDALVKGGF